LKPSLLIAGSGRMARNIGLYFFERGYPVFWVSHSAEQLARLEKETTRRSKRIARLFPGQEKSLSARFSTYSTLPCFTPDIILETTSESLERKKEAFLAFKSLISSETLLLTNSSSILPHEIHPDCLGLHFFYPVELTGMVELICTGSHLAGKKERLLNFLRDNTFDVLEQDKDSAFLANRLLLPLQARCLRALIAGWPADEINKASKSRILPIGQLALMDSIGLDVLTAAVRTYQARMVKEERRGYEEFARSLEELLALGKLGDKNRDGLLQGSPLPWPSRAMREQECKQFADQLLQLFIRGCRQAVQSGQVTRQGLDRMLELIFHSNCSCEELFCENIK
jgi:3-hydroxyacyl-CoA dehydrogenase